MLHNVCTDKCEFNTHHVIYYYCIYLHCMPNLYGADDVGNFVTGIHGLYIFEYDYNLYHSITLQ